jgi:hypothetical protein
MAWLLGAEWGPLLWYVAMLSPGLAVAACAAFLRWGYAVVMVGVFALIPISFAVRQGDATLLTSPPIAALATAGGLLLAFAYGAFLLVLVKSPAALRHRHVPWF